MVYGKPYGKNLIKYVENHNYIFGKNPYSSYIKDLEGLGWIKDHRTITEKDNEFVGKYPFQRWIGRDDLVICIRCPDVMKMTVMGTKQVPKDLDLRNAFTFQIKLMKNDIELNRFASIRMDIESDHDILHLKKVFYDDIHTKTDKDKLYRFDNGFLLNGGSVLAVYTAETISPDMKIDFDRTKFELETDVWSK